MDEDESRNVGHVQFLIASSLCWMTSALRNLPGGGAERRQFKPKKLIAVYEGKYGDTAMPCMTGSTMSSPRRR
jgi:hypothetical protein